MPPASRSLSHEGKLTFKGGKTTFKLKALKPKPTDVFITSPFMLNCYDYIVIIISVCVSLAATSTQRT